MLGSLQFLTETHPWPHVRYLLQKPGQYKHTIGPMFEKVLKKSEAKTSDKRETAIFAAGCFWWVWFHGRPPTIRWCPGLWF